MRATSIRLLCLALLLMMGSGGLAAPGNYPKVSVGEHLGRPVVLLDGKPLDWSCYCPVYFAKHIAVQNLPRFFPHQMGVYQIGPVRAAGGFLSTQYWVGDKISSEPLVETPSNQFTDMGECADFILEGDPGACLVVRFSLHEPPTWKELHPEEYVVNEEGRRLDCPSLASDVYYDAACRYSAAIIEYTERQAWSRRVIGYGNFYHTEGVQAAAIEGWLYDHSAVMTTRWRRFLTEKYRTDAALQAAWGDPQVTLATVEVPRDKLRGPTPRVSNLLYWQAGSDNAPLTDYLLLQKELFHQRSRELYAAMREATDRPRFFVYDALKQTMQGWNCGDFFSRRESRRLADPELMAASGSMGVAELTAVPGFDGLMTPHDYQARGVGGIFEPEGIVDSMILRGKIFWTEMDQRTYAERENSYGNARDLREFAAITWRNLATTLARGSYFYWMDLTQDWYALPELHEVIGRQREVIKESLQWPHETVPGIAMVLDDSSVLETNGAGNYMNEAIMWEQKMGLARCGVPYRIYLLEDLALPNFPAHKVFYFPNLYKVDEERLALLQQKVFCNGNVVIWGPGSGISDGQTISAESATRLTGFAFKFWPVNFTRKTLLSNFEHPLTRGLSADTVISGTPSYGPLLFPTDGTELGLAWTKNGDTIAGLAAKERGSGAGRWHSVFTSAVPLPAGLWRNAARWAGAHVYSESGDVLMADSTIVALHSLQTGEKRIELPGRYTVWDVVTGKLVGRNLHALVFRMQAPETRVFRLEDAA